LNKKVIETKQKNHSWWIITLLTIVAVILTASLGVWQLNRAAQKQALKNNIEAKAKQASLQDLAWINQTFEENEHRTVKVKGFWLADKTVYLENRQMLGKPGFFVLTPLMLSQTQPAQIVMVQRGWVQRNFLKRDELAPIETSKEEVEITARIAHWPSRLYEFDQTENGKIRQNISYDTFQKELPNTLLNSSLIQTGSDSEGLKRQWDFTFIKVDMHYGYAFQWFSFSVIILGLYLGFFWLRIKKDKTKTLQVNQ
jgi:surfeit locus 1 family protein